jgi:hypothetical protein
MKRAAFTLAIIALFVLHQDVWFWRTAQPLVLGFLPVGLFYHACFTVAASLLLAMLVKYAWPAHLEEEIDHSFSSQSASGNQMFEEDGAS